MSNLIILYFGESDRVGIRCQHCKETVDKSEYNGDTDECNAGSSHCAKCQSANSPSSKFIRCPGCTFEVPVDEFNGDTNECYECHDAGADPGDCRCERCFERQVMAADFYEQD
jgi:hypothetical protein